MSEVIQALGQDPIIVETEAAINWRKLIPDEFLYPNREQFERRGQPVPESIEGLEDSQLLVKLGGIKHVAKLRGYESVKYQVVKADRDHVVVVCSITWRSGWQSTQEGNKFYYETYDGIGAAHLDNTSSFMVNFLEASAENRAFVRAVRNYLGINIVGDDEIAKGPKFVAQQEAIMDAPSDKPQDLVRAAAKKKSLNSKEAMVEFLTLAKIDETILKKFEEEGLDKLSARDCRTLISALSK